jgi:hypothetical protein
MSCRGTVGEERGDGGEERVQFNANQGWEWTRIAPQLKKGISKSVQKGMGGKVAKSEVRGNVCRRLFDTYQ